MRHQEHPGPWRRVVLLAEEQGGAISSEQLRGAGLGGSAIARRVQTGHLHPRYRGVYSVGHRILGPKGRLVAATLAYGPEAVISHRHAAEWWGFWEAPRRVIDVTVPGRTRHARLGLQLHRVRTLDTRDVTVHEGVSVTRVARTLLDLAEVVAPRQLLRALEKADRLGRFDADDVHELLQRSPGRRGLRPLSLLLSDFHDEPLLLSELEELFYDLCDPEGIPRPVTNTKVMGFWVDAFWPEHNAIVEVDSRKHHLNGRAFEEDRLRDATLLTAGYKVMRVTHWQLKNDRAGVAQRIRKLLGIP